MRKFVVFFVGFCFLFCLTCCKKNETKSSKNEIQRIVALSPSAVEILFDIDAGNQVVAVPEFTDFPPQAAELPHVGGFDGKTLSIESILSYKPDLVYMTDVMHNYMIPQLEEYGIQYYISTADSINGIEKEVLEVGELTGHSEKAKEVVAEMEEKLSSVKKNTEKKSAFYEVWNVPYMTCGSKSFINDVLNVAGYENIFADVEDAYPQVSEEAIIARNPEVIFITQSSGVTVESVKKRAGWENVSAVVNNNVIMVDDNLFSRPVPRVLDVLNLYEKE